MTKVKKPFDVERAIRLLRKAVAPFPKAALFELAAEGHSNPAIAERLFISPRTAETHRARFMEKLGLRSRAELVLYAVERGLIRRRAHGPEPPTGKI